MKFWSYCLSTILYNILIFILEWHSTHRRCYVKIDLLKNFHKFQKKTFVFESVQACNFFLKRLQHKVLSCEICEISKKIYFEEHLRTTASVVKSLSEIFQVILIFNEFIRVVCKTYLDTGKSQVSYSSKYK